MATIVKPTPKENRELTLNKTIKLPRDRYTLRITKEEFTLSKEKKAPMIVLSFEFVAPDVITDPATGARVNIAGCELKPKYMTLRSIDDDGEINEEKSQTCFNMYSDLRDLLGVPVGEEGVDIDNPPKVFEKLIIDAICDGEEFVQRKDPTPEQKKKRQLGDVILDQNGKECKSYFPYVVEIRGLANAAAQETAANRPF